jgi:hypothetical protein
VKPRAGADIRPWLARAGVLRAPVAAYGETLLVREALSTAPRLRAIQSPAAAFGSWIGLPFPGGNAPMEPVPRQNDVGPSSWGAMICKGSHAARD